MNEKNKNAVLDVNEEKNCVMFQSVTSKERNKNNVNDQSNDKKRKRNDNSKNSSSLESPHCKLCEVEYDMTDFSDNSPVMSMKCFHTICRGCITKSIQRRRIKLRRSNVNATPCPFQSCEAPNAFRNDCINWNMELMSYHKKISSYYN